MTTPSRSAGPVPDSYRSATAKPSSSYFALKPRGPFEPSSRVDGECEGPCTASVPIVGEAAPSGLLCPSVLDFGTMNPGGCARRVLNCPSILDETAEVIGWQVESPSGTFSGEGPERFDVTPGGAVALPMRFCPSSLGEEQGRIVLTVREPRTGVDVVSVDLLGVGGGPDLVVTPGTLRFGGARVTDTTERTLVVENAGHARMDLSTWSISGPFELASQPPLSLEPAETRPIRLRFVPTQEGPAEGALTIESNDPNNGRLVVPLLGTGVPIKPCSATLTPATVTFGLVNQGEQRLESITLRSSSTESCAWFQPRIEGSDAFRLVGAVPFSGVVTASQSVSFDVAFAPSRLSPLGTDNAQLVVDLPNAQSRVMRTGLQGVAVSSDLQVHPRRLDFGKVGTDVAVERTVRLYNLSSQPERISSVALSPGTSPDFALTGPSGSVDLLPGEHIEVTVTYAPKTPGRDGGRVSFVIAGFIASFDVSLLGEAGDDSLRGYLTGHVCTPDGRYPSARTEVIVRYGPQVFKTTMTNEDGGFQFDGLPPGRATVSFRKGHFTRTVQATIVADQTTTIPRTCLDPTSPSVAVVAGDHDRVQVILQQLGIPYDYYDTGTLVPDLLADRDLLLSYEILMLNCGFNDLTVRQPNIASNLQAFLGAGGSIYASDFAYDAIEAAVPAMLDFSGTDTIQNAAELGSVTLMPGRAIEPTLLRWMPPRLRFEVNLVLGYAQVDNYGPDAQVLVLGDHGAMAEPLVITTGLPGRIAYTSYHYTATQVDPAALIPLTYAIFGL